VEPKVETVPNMRQEDDVGDGWDDDSKEGREEVKGKVGVEDSDVKDRA